MDALVMAQGPAFAAGFAVQQLPEQLDPIVERFSSAGVKDIKKIIFSAIALVIGFALALGTDIRVLEPLGYTGTDAWDIEVTAFVVSAGTQGLNSILKFLGYAKEAKKGEAKKKRDAANLGEDQVGPPLIGCDQRRPKDLPGAHRTTVDLERRPPFVGVHPRQSYFIRPGQFGGRA